MAKMQGAVVAVGFTCLLLLSSLSTRADEGHGGMMHGGHDQGEQDEHSAHYLKHLLKHAKELGLTPEQISKLKAIQLDFKRSEARLEADAKVAKLDLHALLEDEQADLTVIQAKVEQLKKAEGACLLAAIKSTRTAIALLTPEQREKDRAYREHTKSSGEGQHGGGMGGMGHGGMMGGRGGMGGMMGGMGGGAMGGSGHGQNGQSGGDHESGGSSGGQQHQH
ncbi:MAG: periplasmic heavy metal sensor [Nitrospira sp.]